MDRLDLRFVLIPVQQYEKTCPDALSDRAAYTVGWRSGWSDSLAR